MSMENADIKRQIQDKVFVITSLKNDLRKLKGKEVKNTKQIPIATTVAPGMFKLDLDLAPRLLQNREAHICYLKHTQEQADILRGIESLVYVRDTCPNAIKLSEKKVDITLMNKVKKVRFSEPLTSSSNVKQDLKVKSTGILFTIVGNSCPLTRITSANLVHPKKTTSHSVETQKPKIKVYSRIPKQIKSEGSSKKAKIVESKIANNSEPNHLWGSNATDVPSSSSLLVNDRLSRCSLYLDTVCSKLCRERFSIS
ncbi:hypothetical protein Tco_0666211 [Tanacetum coccineum]